MSFFKNNISIRGYVYLLMGTVLTIAIAILGFLEWRRSRIAHLQVQVIDYHISSLSEAHVVIGEAFWIEAAASARLHSSADMRDPAGGPQAGSQLDRRLRAAVAIIDQCLVKILDAQERFAVRDFEMMARAASERWGDLSLASHATLDDFISSEANIEPFVLTIRQLERMHEAGLVAAQLGIGETQSRDARLLAIVAGILLIPGFIVMRRLLHGIDAILNAQAKSTEALRASEQRLDALFTRAPAGLSITDDRLRFVKINETMAEINGPSVEEHLGKTIGEVLPALAPTLEPLMRNVIETGVSDDNRKLKGETPRFPGELRHWVASNFPIPSGDGGRPGVGSIVVETTHQKHVEENQERLIAELTNKNDELERFNYTASHDLKAPLITIRGFLGVLLEEAAAGRVDLMNDAIERIDRAAGKMQGLLEDLLDFSRVTSSRDERKQVLLTKLLDEVLELIAGQIARGNARVEVSPELPTVFADPSRLRTLFQNLIANAVKFMGDQLQPLIEVGCEQRDAELLYYVRDNGMGIDSRYHEKIFGLFDRLNPNAEGSGVGLAIARRIVELYGGRIWVQSEGRGQGCAFYFTLPQSD